MPAGIDDAALPAPGGRRRGLIRNFETLGEHLLERLYGDPCDDLYQTGLFSHPRTLEVIGVAGAGCARFWIEFELGNWLLPALACEDLNVLDRGIVDLAERTYELQFAQGCRWGSRVVVTTRAVKPGSPGPLRWFPLRNSLAALTQSAEVQE